MATKDFRASQIETSKIIGTGSISGTTAGIAIYSGSISSNREGGVSDSSIFNNVGSDVFLFVSGTISNSDNTRTDATLFGGDVVISGTLYAERQVIEVDSVADGDFYVTGNMYVKPDSNSTKAVQFSNAAGNSVFVVNTSSPAVDIDGALILTGNIYGGASDSALFINSEGAISLNADSNSSAATTGVNIQHQGVTHHSFGEGFGAIFNFQRDASQDFSVRGDNDYASIFVDAGEDAVALGATLDDSPAWSDFTETGTDVKILLSGTVGSRGGATRGTTLNAGDLVVSGTTRIEGDTILSGNLISENKSTGQSGFQIRSPGSMFFVVDEDSSGIDQFVFVKDSTSGNQFLNMTEGSGATFNSNRTSDFDFAVRGDNDYALIFVDASEDAVALGATLDGSPAFSDFAGEVGSDVKILLSGTVGSKGGATRGATLVAGDMHVSGTITSDNTTFGGSLDLSYDTSDTLGHVPNSGHGAVIIVDQQPVQLVRGTPGDVVLGVTGSAIFGETSSEFGNHLPPLPGDDTMFFFSGSIGSRGASTGGVSVFGGDLVVSGNLDVDSNDISLIANSRLRFNNPGENDQFIYGNNSTLTIDGDNYVQLNADLAVNIAASSNNTQMTSATTEFNTTRADVDFEVNTDDYYATFFIDGNDNTIIMGNEDFTSNPNASDVNGYGDDVKIMLSGSAGSKDSSTRGVTLVTGDLVVSGSLYAGRQTFIQRLNWQSTIADETPRLPAFNSFGASTTGDVELYWTALGSGSFRAVDLWVSEGSTARLALSFFANSRATPVCHVSGSFVNVDILGDGNRGHFYVDLEKHINFVTGSNLFNPGDIITVGLSKLSGGSFSNVMGTLYYDMDVINLENNNTSGTPS